MYKGSSFCFSCSKCYQIPASECAQAFDGLKWVGSAPPEEAIFRVRITVNNSQQAK